MRMRRLPNSDLVISEIGLGTLTFGDQLAKHACFSVLDAAVDELHFNFIDTAESFPAPSTPGTAGNSERIVGDWLKSRGWHKSGANRDKIVLSTKISGFSDELTWLRGNGAGTRVTREQVTAAVDAQLARLGVDHIDLLQIHWPDRYVPVFGAPEYQQELERSDATPIVEQVQIMSELVKSGKVRSWGLANESPYGIGAFTAAADLLHLQRPVSTQAPYNLLTRTDVEHGLIEACAPVNGNIGIIANSPLAGGALTGKYLDPRKTDPKARLFAYMGFMHRYIAPPAAEATRKYKKLAESYNMPLAPLALAWVLTRPFITSTLIGATHTAQLHENVKGLNVLIDQDSELHRAISDIYRADVDPTRGVFNVVDPNEYRIDPSKLPWGAKDEDIDPELDIIINQRMSNM